jgi:hypothetical protein
MWRLEYDRGIQNLRGLVGQVSTVCFAPNGRMVAALSHDWRIGIWDLSTGFFRHLFYAPQGWTADNAALVFSKDGQKFAFAAGTEARLWDLSNGREIAWHLPLGLVDTLAFDETDKRLRLIRMEAADRLHNPDSRVVSRHYSRVLRARDLLASPERDLRGADKDKVLWENGFFDAIVYRAEATADGRYFVVLGLHGREPVQRVIKVLESATGKERWSHTCVNNVGDFHLEAIGKLLEFHPGGVVPSSVPYRFVAIPDGTPLGPAIPPAEAMSPGADLLAVRRNDSFGFALHRRGDKHPLVVLGIDTLIAPPERAAFSHDGSLLAWGNRDGTVTVCRLEDVRRRLAEVDLGW